MENINDNIVLITAEKADEIIDTRKPFGLFYLFDNGVFVGIDNRDGDAWTEEFKTKKECIEWLKGGF